MLRRPLVDDLLQEVGYKRNLLAGSTLTAILYHSQQGHGKPKAGTPHSSKSQERYRWCAVGQAVPESGRGPQSACLKICWAAYRQRKWRWLRAKRRGQLEAGLTIEKRSVLAAELTHKLPRERTE